MRKRYETSSHRGGLEENLKELERTKASIHSLPFYFGIILLLLLLGLYGIVYAIDQILPTPLSLEDEATNPDAFITSRARHDLKILTDLGPRIAGSYENEVLAVDFLKREIDFIIQQSNKNQQIEIDVQTATGAFSIGEPLSGKILVYSNIQNVIVKLHGENNESLLINAHFDSVPTSPGGSDDGINCAVMLEILRKLSRTAQPPLNNIVFLFNGAEETSLQASHAFITQHQWAKDCKVVVNLEATGAGGKIILFQTGPDASWLMDYYNRVPHPYGQVAGEEIFQSNLIPSDTDFRIFRDFGGLVGYDMAFFKSGYVYHTKYDGFDNIPEGSFQHVGDNTLHLVRSLSNAVELQHPKTNDDKIVYYDILGLFMVSYTRLTGNVINYLTVILSFVVFIIAHYNFKLGFSRNILIYFVKNLGAILGGWILAVLFIYMFSLIVNTLGYSMSWYGNPWLIFGLFTIPTIAITSCLLPLIKYNNSTCNIQAQMQSHLIRLLWTVILLIGTIFNLRTMYALMIPIMFNSAAFILIYLFQLQRSIRKWQIIYLILNIIPTIPTMYQALTTLSLFIPISGRIGSDKNADLIIGVMSLLFTILITSAFVALISLLRDFRYFILILFGLFLINFIIIFTPLGFPYSGDRNNPTPERFWILHTRRVFHGENGDEIKRDSGYFLLNMDRNSPYKVRPYVKELSKARSLKEDCDKYLLCGLPLAHSKMIGIMQYSSWVPAGQPILPDSVHLEILSKTHLSSNIIRYNVSVDGPDRLGVYLSPKPGVNITQISLIDVMPSIDYVPKFNGRPVYFMMHIFGKEPAPFQFTFDVEMPENHNNATTEIALSGIYVHDKLNRKVPHFIQFLNQFPDWTDITAWLSTYESWWI